MLSSPLILSVQKTLTDLKVSPSHSILVGVSGGADSMVLLSVLMELGYSPTAAHVNFQLRGQASDDDAALVREWCSERNVKYYELASNTKEYAASHHLNVQSAAREIRYDWWKDLIRTGSFDFVATAHHKDDSIETIFLNLLRGTGIKGLTGIPLQRDFFIRPLITVSRAEIESYASSYHVPFRNDSSNDADDYQRNRIRHHLIPLLKELNPNFDSVMSHDMNRIGLEWKAWENAYQSWQQKSITRHDDDYSIKVEQPEHAFLLKWLEEHEFPWNLALDFITSHNADGGKILEYNMYQLSRTAAGFYFKKIEKVSSVIIPEPGSYQIEGKVLTIEMVSLKEFQISTDPWIQFADLENIKWPLTLSTVMPGDHFQPFGMNGQRKKVQDYLVDLKLDQHEKDQVRILKSADHILWLTGMRLDERIKVKPDSKKIYRLKFATKN